MVRKAELRLSVINPALAGNYRLHVELSTVENQVGNYKPVSLSSVCIVTIIRTIILLLEHLPAKKPDVGLSGSRYRQI